MQNIGIAHTGSYGSYYDIANEDLANTILVE